MVLLSCTLVASLALGPTPDVPDVIYQRSLDTLLEKAFPDGETPFDRSGTGSREIFLQVLSSDLFLHKEVGPFDIYMMVSDNVADAEQAQFALDRVAHSIKKTVPVMDRYFSGRDGLIAGRRLPIVLTDSSGVANGTGFDQLIALLDWCEDDYTGWKSGGTLLWTPALRRAVTVRTWEVQLFNLGHSTVRNQRSAAIDAAGAKGKLAEYESGKTGKKSKSKRRRRGEEEEEEEPVYEVPDPYLDHGIGYHTMAHVVGRVLLEGTKGIVVPPWLVHGLIDELDITAYGQAWVGHDSFEMYRPGWYREGWSGFLPDGHAPPVQPAGAPDLAIEVKRTGNRWDHRDLSAQRHWEDLAEDRSSAMPASFASMAKHESFTPRDRAYARWTIHMLLNVAAPEGRDGLLATMDRVPDVPPSMMPDTEPITSILGSFLGGLEEVETLESLPMGEFLQSLGREDIVRRIEDLGGEEMLQLRDHREQAEWLYSQTADDMDMDTRWELWQYIHEAEFYQQFQAWEAVGKVLDRGAEAAFEAVSIYPARDKEREKAATAFWQAIASAS